MIVTSGRRNLTLVLPTQARAPSPPPPCSSGLSSTSTARPFAPCSLQLCWAWTSRVKAMPLGWALVPHRRPCLLLSGGASSVSFTPRQTKTALGPKHQLRCLAVVSAPPGSDGPLGHSLCWTKSPQPHPVSALSLACHQVPPGAWPTHLGYCTRATKVGTRHETARG